MVRLTFRKSIFRAKIHGANGSYGATNVDKLKQSEAKKNNVLPTDPVDT